MEENKKEVQKEEIINNYIKLKITSIINTVKLQTENEELKQQLQHKTEECEELKEKLDKIKKILFAKDINDIDMSLQERVIKIIRVIGKTNESEE